MERLIRYPRGFTTTVNPAAIIKPQSTANDVDLVPCDPVLEQLYKIYMSNNNFNPSWDFCSQVITRCSNLFGDFRRWLILQTMTNDNIYDINLEFLKDTVNYIRTGTRLMPIVNWRDLMAEYPDPVPGCANRHRFDSLALSDNEFDNYIGLWCSWDGGFHDMLCTAYTLFGASKKPFVSQSL
jgi:hypothetical protein